MKLISLVIADMRNEIEAAARSRNSQELTRFAMFLEDYSKLLFDEAFHKALDEEDQAAGR